MSKDTLNFSAPVPWDDDDAPGLAPALSMGEIDATLAALRAQNAELVAALLEIAMQKLAVEMDEADGGDWEAGYEGCVKRARAALAAEPASADATPTQSEGLERKLFYDDRGIYIGDTRAQAIRTLIHALNLAVSRGCDHCAETIRQARALAAAGHTQGSGE